MLERKEVNKIRAEYIAGETVEKLAEKYRHSHVTLMGYRDEEDWNALRKIAQTKAAQKAVGTISDRMARDMNVLEAAKMSMARNLKARLEAKEDLKFSPREWGELDKSEALLDGRPTERIEDGRTSDGDIPARLGELVEYFRRIGVDLKLNGFESLLAQDTQPIN